MTDLERQLRGYATAVLDRVDPVRAEQIVQAHPWRRHHRRVGLALVLVGVLAVGLAVTMWAATRGTGPAITTTTRVGAPLPTSWSRVSAFPTSGAEAATSSGGRVVVVGGGGIFFSGDARTWTSVLDTAPVGEVNAVITDGSGFVAAGDAPDPAGGRPGRWPRSGRRPTGRTGRGCRIRRWSPPRRRSPPVTRRRSRGRSGASVGVDPGSSRSGESSPAALSAESWLDRQTRPPFGSPPTPSTGRA